MLAGGPAEGTVADSVVRRPPPGLRPYVAAQVGYRYAGFPPGTHLGLPSPYLTVVISLADPTRLDATPDPAQAPGWWPALVGGLHTRPAVIRHDGTQHGVQLSLTPAGSRALLGLPAGALSPCVVDLEDVLGSDAAELLERMRSTSGWEGAFAVLDAVLARRLGQPHTAPAELARAWHALVTDGTVRVGDVAAEVGWSRRYLGQRFVAEYGLTPKHAVRVARFWRSSRMLRGAAPGHAPTVAHVAAHCGYFDQAHLAREWRELAGCPPTAWLAAEHLPSVQDGDLVAVASSTA